jgi:hypothetical protein
VRLPLVGRILFGGQGLDDERLSNAGPVVGFHLPREVKACDPAQARRGDELHTQRELHGLQPL